MGPGTRVTGYLPAELTSFVGRRGELAEDKRLLAGSRLVTLTGIGGVGKTRLALRAAAGLRRAFRDGVWLVQLDQLRDQALVAQAVAVALGLQDRADYAPAASLAEYLAGRQLLLVLDNCEHLVDAAAKLADLLLRAAAGLRVLATSRESLNITGETVLAVPPLRAPKAGRRLTVAELARFPAVGLFAERAAQMVPGFALTEANVAAVAGICRRLEGLPLAIELAAARVAVLSPEQIDARLGDRLGLLTRGGRTRPARQQTLRASIEWSYELCSPAERLLWARLSVFNGGCELDAAEGICADHRLAAGEVLDLLAALAGKSILIAAHRKGGVRYRLPETLREFGQERLQESGEYTALRRRHRDWHEQLARKVDTDWLSPQIADWTTRLHREHCNVNAAQDFCQAEPGEDEAGLRIALHVWLFYYWNAGHVSEGRYRLGQALARAREPTARRAQGLLLASFLAAVSGDRGAVQPLLQQGTSLAWIAASRQQYERAAVLLGAATGLLQFMGTTLDGNQHVAGYHRDCERQARQALGEAAFQAAYHRGLELPAEDVLAYALQQPPEKPPQKPSAPAVSEGAPLTPRERQVARLIAGGRSNKNIAAQLVISQRTAENHVGHILAKLGFTSRAQVAAWVAASQPDGEGR